jgi:hypothetical protein
MAKKPIDELGRTTLDWKEYQSRANELLKKVPPNTKWQNFLTQKLGTGFWEFEGKKVDYGFNRARGKIKRKRATVRQANQAASTAQRTSHLKQANELIPEADLKIGKQLQTKIQAVPGRNADHILEVQTFGPVMDQLNKEFAAGAIDQSEYAKRLQILKDANPGDSVKNLQDLSATANQNKKNIVELKNKTLQKMEEANPSFRHLDPKYKQAMEIAEGYNVSKVINKAAKATKPLRKVLRYVPIVGGGMVLLNAKAQAEEAIQNPTWQNKVQAGIAGADAALEGVELATGGIGGLITTPLQIGLMIADQMVHQTEDEFERSTYDYASRRRYRTGQT